MDTRNFALTASLAACVAILWMTSALSVAGQEAGRSAARAAQAAAAAGPGPTIQSLAVGGANLGPTPESEPDAADLECASADAGAGEPAAISDPEADPTPACVSELGAALVCLDCIAGRGWRRYWACGRCARWIWRRVTDPHEARSCVTEMWRRMRGDLLA